MDKEPGGLSAKGGDQKQDPPPSNLGEPDMGPERKALVQAAMMEELGVGRKDSLPLEDKTSHAFKGVTIPSMSDLQRPKGKKLDLEHQKAIDGWKNIHFDDVNPSFEQIDAIANGNLARMRKLALTSNRGARKASVANRKPSHITKYLAAKDKQHGNEARRGRNKSKAIDKSIAQHRKAATAVLPPSPKLRASLSSLQPKVPAASSPKANLSFADDRSVHELPITTRKQAQTSRFTLVTNEEWLKQVGINPTPSQSPVPAPTGISKGEALKNPVVTKPAISYTARADSSSKPVVALPAHGNQRLQETPTRLKSPAPMNTVKVNKPKKFALVSPEAFSLHCGLLSPPMKQPVKQATADQPNEKSVITVTADENIKSPPSQSNTTKENKENADSAPEKSLKNGLASSRWAPIPPLKQKEMAQPKPAPLKEIVFQAKPENTEPLPNRPEPVDIGQLISISGGLKASKWASLGSSREDCFYTQAVSIRRGPEHAVSGSVKILKAVDESRVYIELRTADSTLLKRPLRETNISRLNPVFVTVRSDPGQKKSITWSVQFPFPYLLKSFIKLIHKHEEDSIMENSLFNFTPPPLAQEVTDLITKSGAGNSNSAHIYDMNTVSEQSPLVELSHLEPKDESATQMSTAISSNMQDLLCLVDVKDEPPSQLGSGVKEQAAVELPRRTMSIQDLLKLQDLAAPAPEFLNEPERNLQARKQAPTQTNSKTPQLKKPMVGTAVNTTRSGIPIIPGNTSETQPSYKAYPLQKPISGNSNSKTTVQPTPIVLSDEETKETVSPKLASLDTDNLVKRMEELHLSAKIEQTSPSLDFTPMSKDHLGKVAEEKKRTQLNAMARPFPEEFRRSTSDPVTKFQDNKDKKGSDNHPGTPRQLNAEIHSDQASQTHGSDMGSFGSPSLSRQLPQLPAFVPAPGSPALGTAFPQPLTPATATVLVLDPQTGEYREVTGLLKVGSIPVVATVPAPTSLPAQQHTQLNHSRGSSNPPINKPDMLSPSQIQARLDESLKRGKSRFSLG
ncbi:hypothetical protein F5884DRAFT_76677 [Xylogone sp. PMI_703]|nr:hypothetical protein F5884DRAFT_76677 [Xylogone sp. PMI_703]